MYKNDNLSKKIQGQVLRNTVNASVTKYIEQLCIKWTRWSNDYGSDKSLIWSKSVSF